MARIVAFMLLHQRLSLLMSFCQWENTDIMRHHYVVMLGELCELKTELTRYSTCPTNVTAQPMLLTLYISG